MFVPTTSNPEPNLKVRPILSSVPTPVSIKVSPILNPAPRSVPTSIPIPVGPGRSVPTLNLNVWPTHNPTLSSVPAPVGLSRFVLIPISPSRSVPIPVQPVPTLKPAYLNITRIGAAPFVSLTKQRGICQKYCLYHYQ